MQTNGLPRWLIAAGALLTLVDSAFAVRLVWEQTVLSWERGPQMVGFSLMHGGAGVIFLAVLAASFLWLVATLALAAKRRSLGGPLGLATISICAISLSAILIPYSWWQTAFTSKLAQGPFAAEFLSMAAAQGHERLVTALLEEGVAVSARTRDGSTALHGAAASGEVKLVELLITHGADVNAVNRYGNSPLANAESSGYGQVAEFLRRHGAESIRGTDEQRERAARELIEKHYDQSLQK